MFNVTVLKMRDIIKYLVGTILTVIIVIYTTRYFSNFKNRKNDIQNESKIKIESLQGGSLTGCLDKTIPMMSNINKEYKELENDNKEDK